MTAGEQAQQQAMQHLVLTDQDFADLGLERGESVLKGGDVFFEAIRHIGQGEKSAVRRALSTGDGRVTFPNPYGWMNKKLSTG